MDTSRRGFFGRALAGIGGLLGIGAVAKAELSEDDKLRNLIKAFKDKPPGRWSAPPSLSEQIREDPRFEVDGHYVQSSPTSERIVAEYQVAVKRCPDWCSWRKLGFDLIEEHRVRKTYIPDGYRLVGLEHSTREGIGLTYNEMTAREVWERV